MDGLYGILLEFSFLSFSVKSKYDVIICRNGIAVLIFLVNHSLVPNVSIWSRFHVNIVFVSKCTSIEGFDQKSRNLKSPCPDFDKQPRN